MPLESISRKYSRLIYTPRAQYVQCSQIQEFTRKKKLHRTSLAKKNKTKSKTDETLERIYCSSLLGTGTDYLPVGNSVSVKGDGPLPLISSASYKCMLCLQLPVGEFTQIMFTVKQL